MSGHLPGNPYAGREPHTDAGGVITALDTLAFEQRTANLIAYLDLVTREFGNPDKVRHLDGIIRARLGMNSEADEERARRKENW